MGGVTNSEEFGNENETNRRKTNIFGNYLNIKEPFTYKKTLLS